MGLRRKVRLSDRRASSMRMLVHGEQLVTIHRPSEDRKECQGRLRPGGWRAPRRARPGSSRRSWAIRRRWRGSEPAPARQRPTAATSAIEKTPPAWRWLIQCYTLAPSLVEQPSESFRNFRPPHALSNSTTALSLDKDQYLLVERRLMYLAVPWTVCMWSSGNLWIVSSFLRLLVTAATPSPPMSSRSSLRTAPLADRRTFAPHGRRLAAPRRQTLNTHEYAAIGRPSGHCRYVPRDVPQDQERLTDTEHRRRP